MEPNRSYIILAAVSLFLGLIHNFLFFEKGFGLNIAIFTILIIAGGIFLLRQFGRGLDRQGAILFILPAVIFAGMVVLRASELLTFFNTVAIALLFLFYASLSQGKNIRSYLPVDYLKVALLPIRFVRPFFLVMGRVFDLKNIKGLSPASREVVRGGLFALIALFLFGLLFASADEVFRQLLPDLNLAIFNEEFFGRSIIAAIITALFIGAFGYLFAKPDNSQPSAVNPLERRFGALEATILLGAINALFLVFTLLQITYLFGGESRVAELGLTYAEYARKGFFELIVVSILSFGVIFVAEAMVVKKEGAHYLRFKVLSVALLLQVVLILTSAFTRLSLYEQAYGFTDTRLYSHALMIWMGFVIVFFAYQILSNGKSEAFLYRTLLLSMLFLLGINILNPDVFIARYNIARYESTGKLDTTYLARLSDDALPEIIGLLDDPDEAVRNSFAKELYRVRDRDDRDSTNWESYRLPRIKARELLAPKRSQLEASKDLLITH